MMLHARQNQRKSRISLVLCSLIRTFGFAEGTSARTNPKKKAFFFGSLLAYSYLCGLYGKL